VVELLRHYQPPVPAAENYLSYEEKNKANKDVDGEQVHHDAFIFSYFGRNYQALWPLSIDFIFIVKLPKRDDSGRKRIGARLMLHKKTDPFTIQNCAIFGKFKEIGGMARRRTRVRRTSGYRRLTPKLPKRADSGRQLVGV
jgi:hypothetical protein